MAWDGDSFTLQSLSLQPSMSAVLRDIRRQELSLFNCVASIIEDAAFVQQIAELWAGLPLFANLRCGLWYTPAPPGTCYFKSTDGHSGNWSFSTTRLNLHVAEAAAAQGGALVVDATRRGKKFPDALAKTVPCWAAVINRMVAQLRQQGGDDGGDLPGWDCDVHLPPWLSGNERHQIRLRLDGWVTQLQEVGADLSPLASTLRKPLRCVWVSPGSRVWGEAPSLDDLAFTPLVLVSASLPNGRGRTTLAVPPPDSAARAPAPVPPPAQLGKGGSASEGDSDESSDEAAAAAAEEEEEEATAVTYDYIPGAGDDEESWAQGLTPALMWANARALLLAGQHGITAAVQDLLQRDGSGPSRSGDRQQQQRQRSRRRQQQRQSADHTPEDGDRGSGAGAQPAAHCLPPQGCVAASGAAAVGAGIYLLGDSGLALGALGSGAAPGVWQHVGAVLNVGQRQHPSMREEPATPVCSAAGPSGGDGGSGATGALDLAGAPTRYLWLPVARPWEDKRALLCALHPALRFASHHLEAGRRVLVHCDDGTDASVCTALSVLLACHRLEGRPGASTSSGSGGGGGSGGNMAVLHQPYSLLPGGGGAPALAAPGPFTRLTMRQYLATISSAYPDARPSQALLKQAFNFWLSGPDGHWKQRASA